MIKYIVILLIGLGVGYTFGYKDAKAGLPSIAERALNKFGADKIRKDAEARDKREAAASSPTP